MKLKLGLLAVVTLGVTTVAVATVPAAAHDGSTTSSDGIVTVNETIAPQGSSDDAFNGYRIFLSSPRHADSGGRGECTNPGRQENVNGRYWNMNAGNGNWVYNNFNSTSRIRNFHARGFEVRISKNKKDGDYSDNVVNSINFGANFHVITHTNAAGGGCGGGGDYFLTMWDSYGDSLHCNAYQNYMAADVPGPDNQWQNTGLAELNRNASNGDCYVELQFHTNQTRQSWLYSQSLHHSFLYGKSVDTAMGYP